MAAPGSGEVTRLLQSWSGGDKEALDELVPFVYRELRGLAAAYLRRERRDHTLQPTALVHEAYLRLVDQTQVESPSRAQFFGIAANLMRQILVDHARRPSRGQAGRRQQSGLLRKALGVVRRAGMWTSLRWTRLWTSWRNSTRGKAASWSCDSLGA